MFLTAEIDETDLAELIRIGLRDRGIVGVKFEVVRTTRPPHRANWDVKCIDYDVWDPHRVDLIIGNMLPALYRAYQLSPVNRALH
jgi:hypothetical protein